MQPVLSLTTAATAGGGPKLLRRVCAWPRRRGACGRRRGEGAVRVGGRVERRRRPRGGRPGLGPGAVPRAAAGGRLLRCLGVPGDGGSLVRPRAAARTQLRLDLMLAPACSALLAGAGRLCRGSLADLGRGAEEVLAPRSVIRSGPGRRVLSASAATGIIWDPNPLANSQVSHILTHPKLS